LNEPGRNIYDNWPECKQLAKLWDNLSNVRNALDHAGHQKGAMKLNTILKKVETSIMPELRKLVSIWKLSSTQ